MKSRETSKLQFNTSESNSKNKELESSKYEDNGVCRRLLKRFIRFLIVQVGLLVLVMIFNIFVYYKRK
jgi:hypothetical protein